MSEHRPRPLDAHEQLETYEVDRSTGENDSTNPINSVRPREMDPQETLDHWLGS